MSKSTQQVALLFVVGLLVGVAVTKLFLSPAEEVKDTELVTTVPKAIETTSTESISSGELTLPPTIPSNTRVNLSVLDQSAGPNVQVTSVNVSEPTWVAIYEDIQGRAGSILGAKKVVAGDTFVVVELLRPEGLTKGANYYAVLLPDNGDGTFDRKSDTPEMTSDKVNIVKFKAL